MPKPRMRRMEIALYAAPLLLLVLVGGSRVLPEVVRVAKGYPRELPTSERNFLRTISLSRDGRVLAAGEEIQRPTSATTNIIYLWDAQTLRPLKPLLRPLPPFDMPHPKGRDESTLSVSLSPNGKTLGWSCYPSGFSFVDLKTREVRWIAPDDRADAVYAPDGKKLVFAGGRSIKVVEPKTGRVMRSWKTNEGDYHLTSTFSSSGQYFASTESGHLSRNWLLDSTRDGLAMELRRTSDWKVQRIFPLRNISAIAFSPDERFLIGVAQITDFQAGTWEGSRLQCFEVATGKVVWQLDSRLKGSDPRLKHITDALYSPDGKTVVVNPSDYFVHLLDAHTGKVVRSLPVRDRFNSLLPRSLVFSPDGKRLFVRGPHAVLVWDL